MRRIVFSAVVLTLCAIATLGMRPWVANAASPMQPVSTQARAMLLATVSRLEARLHDRGITCPANEQREVIPCAVLNRLRNRVDVLIGATSSASSSSSRSSASSHTSVSSSSSSLRALDPMTDTELQTSTVQLLGETTQIAASVEIFISEEPVDVTDVLLDVSGVADAIDSFLVYDDDRRLLGRATLQSGQYRLHLAPQTLIVPQKTSRSFYVRAQLAPYDRLKTSGHIFEVNTVTVKGNGVWSSDQYIKPVTDVFPTIETARATFTAMTNTSPVSGFLHDGTSTALIDLLLKGRQTDSAAQLRVTDLTFTVASRDVSLTNLSLTTPGTGVQTSCSQAGTTITCAGLSAALGTVQNERTLELRGDVTVAPGAVNPFLQVILQSSGDPLHAGDITWTDGSTVFEWVPFATPVARGTLLSQ